MAHFLPITLDEVKRLGWDSVDVVLVTGDAYIDHPAFGTALIGRTLEAAGFRVAVIPQPNWRDDLRDFRKFGRPRSSHHPVVPAVFFPPTAIAPFPLFRIIEN